jgi:crotonobetainyl-CoA:carnitine CoA-transferase CaiB-like acyl-CoA transferase
MFDGMMTWMLDAARYSFAGQAVQGKGKGRLWGGFPNYNVYETKDGKFITIGSLEAKFKRTLLEKLGGEDFLGAEDGTTSSTFDDSDADVYNFLQRIFLTKTADEWMAELGPLNICIGPVNTLEEALAHPQTAFRNMVIDVEHPLEGKVKQIGSALKFSKTPSDVNRLPAPQLGEHTNEILNLLGYSEVEIKEMRKNKIIQ